MEISSIEKLRTKIRGAVFCPGQEGYDRARTIPNAMIDRRPAVIARCTGAADVIASVRFGREHDLLVSVRGGGHSVAGKSVCDGGLMIDLSGMKGMRVDLAKRTARAEPGLTLGEFDSETQAFGLATTLGTVTKTGISGLTLGGGWGHLHANYGLALDNLISVDVVTAAGELLTASASENPELFWGLRGSSGNLGIVTSLEYRLHQVGHVFGGAVFYPVTKTREVFHFFREFAGSIPDELVIQTAAVSLPDGTPVCAVVGCYSGTLAHAEEALKPLRMFGTPIGDIFAPISYVQMQSLFDPFFPPGRYTYVKSNFVRTLSDQAIETMAEYANSRPSPYSFAPALEHWHGAAARVAATDTAFPHRNHSYNLMAWSNWADQADSEKNVQWTREFWNAMKPHLVEGSYVNYVSDEGESSARAAYGPNYNRLVALKNKYDPTNFFRMNHNIKPAVAKSA
ncbi:MAG TPA: FAD-binding oxidoreductase [Candidatus Acidoferrum sp.]|jgi:FAD/FMN-containing dehydrogenase|nr:FAD-binding oxidoreductase [Candidatus Acidoferrum sp.]